jgi:hypothetical protein
VLVVAVEVAGGVNVLATTGGAVLFGALLCFARWTAR